MKRISICCAYATRRLGKSFRYGPCGPFFLTLSGRSRKINVAAMAFGLGRDPVGLGVARRAIIAGHQPGAGNANWL